MRFYERADCFSYQSPPAPEGDVVGRGGYKTDSKSTRPHRTTSAPPSPSSPPRRPLTTPTPTAGVDVPSPVPDIEEPPSPLPTPWCTSLPPPAATGGAAACPENETFFLVGGGDSVGRPGAPSGLDPRPANVRSFADDAAPPPAVGATWVDAEERGRDCGGGGGGGGGGGVAATAAAPMSFSEGLDHSDRIACSQGSEERVIGVPLWAATGPSVVVAVVVVCGMPPLKGAASLKETADFVDSSSCKVVAFVMTPWVMLTPLLAAKKGVLAPLL